MPRVTSAKKNKGGKKVYRCRRCGVTIEPGQKYYKYSFRYGGTYYHCADHYPKPSELTQSKIGTVLAAIEAAEERLDAELSYDGPVEDFDSSEYESIAQEIVQEVVEAAEEVRDEYQEALDQWEYGNEMLQERVDEMEDFVSELEGFDASAVYDEPDKSDDREGYEDAVREAIDNYLSELADEVRDVFGNVPG